MDTQVQAGNGLVSKDDRMWGMLCHLSTFVGLLIPLGNIIAPLVIWLLKKNDSSFVDDQGKEALNFQISLLIAVAICIVLSFVFIGIILMFALAIYAIIMVIIASIKANDGNRYRYPYTFRFIN